jgi:DNA-binding SARP family transcriptional activator
VWGEAPPRSADSSLHTYIARLRRQLGRDSIRRSDHSYRLEVERRQIDAIRFEDLLVAATELRDQPGRCRDVCREGLALWRGDPFGDLVDDEPFRLESARLGKLRMSMMELALECELALGHPEIVAAELESAVEEYPYREHLWYLLIEALARDDRRVEALRACHRLRETFAATGLQPSDDLVHLEDWILGNGPAPPRPTPHPPDGSQEPPTARSALGTSSRRGNR